MELAKALCRYSEMSEHVSFGTAAFGGDNATDGELGRDLKSPGYPEPYRIVRRVRQILLGAQIALRRLNGGVAEQ